MERLIDADAILKKAKPMEELDGDGIPCEVMAVSVILIDDAPTVDAVEVVRCRDCTYWGDEDGKLQGSDGVLFARCKAHNYLIDGRHTGWCPSENDFCSYGERKDDDGNG